MQPFTTLSAIACPLAIPNIDTDQLIPARFLRRPRDQGYGDFLLHDLRFDESGNPRDFPLNQPAYRTSQMIVARRNFGCGSSREAAVYALVDYGIRAVIAPSFGDIFASNAVKNGLLPAQVSEEDAERLLAVGGLAADRPVTVDLDRQMITTGNLAMPFQIDPVWKKQLTNGWDDIDLTRAEQPHIDAFMERDRAERPWVVPSAT